MLTNVGTMYYTLLIMSNFLCTFASVVQE